MTSEEEGVFSDTDYDAMGLKWTREQWSALLVDVYSVALGRGTRRQKVDAVRARHGVGHHTYERMVNAMEKFGGIANIIPRPSTRDIEIDELCDVADDLAYITLKAYDMARDVYNESVVQAHQPQSVQRNTAVEALRERLAAIRAVLKRDLEE